MAPGCWIGCRRTRLSQYQSNVTRYRRRAPEGCGTSAVEIVPEVHCSLSWRCWLPNLPLRSWHWVNLCTPTATAAFLQTQHKKLRPTAPSPRFAQKQGSTQACTEVSSSDQSQVTTPYPEQAKLLVAPRRWRGLTETFL